MDEPRPFKILRDPITQDVAYYYVLCPTCKQYSSFAPQGIADKAILSGEQSYNCKSDICKYQTQLKIINGCAVQINNQPKPDVQEREKAKCLLWKPVRNSTFPLPRNSQN